MEAGVTDHVRTMEEIVGLLDRRPEGLVSQRCSVHGRHENLQIDRLQEILIETRVPLSFGTVASGHGHDIAASVPRIGLECSGHVVPIDAGQADIAKDNIRKEASGDLEASDALRSHFDLMACGTQARG